MLSEADEMQEKNDDDGGEIPDKRYSARYKSLVKLILQKSLVIVPNAQVDKSADVRDV